MYIVLLKIFVNIDNAYDRNDYLPSFVKNVLIGMKDWCPVS